MPRVIPEKPFPPELRTASVVPRWSIVWTLTRDTVANHSFYVALYARQISHMIGFPTPWGDTNLGDVMFLAAVDDLDETVTGDIVSPVKHEIIDDKRAAKYIQDKMAQRLTYIVDEVARIKKKYSDKEWEGIRRIIKAADRLDALLFLTIENRLGNGVIEPRVPSAMANMEAAWMALPADKGFLEQLWVTWVIPAIRDHETTGGFGV